MVTKLDFLNFCSEIVKGAVTVNAVSDISTKRVAEHSFPISFFHSVLFAECREGVPGVVRCVIHSVSLAKLYHVFSEVIWGI